MPRREQSEEESIVVNEHEGAVLGLIARMQPLTRYQLFRTFQQSPTTSYNTSPGGLYPLVGRMIDRGFVETEPGKGKRASEMLALTPLGYKALTRWVEYTDPQHSFVHDPLLLRVRSLGDLSRDDRLRWIADTKILLLDKKKELKIHQQADAGSYEDIVQGTAVAIIDAKLEWLDRLLIQVVGESSRNRDT